MLEATPEIELPVVTVTKVTVSLKTFKEDTLMFILNHMSDPASASIKQQLLIDQDAVLSSEDKAKLSPESYPALAEYFRDTFNLPSLRLQGGTQFIVDTEDFWNSGMLKRMHEEFIQSQITS